MEKISSRKNSKILHMKKLGASREYRRTCGEYLCDGYTLLREALLSNAEVTGVLTCDRESGGMPQNLPVTFVPRSLLEYVSPMKAPQDVVFSCKIPQELKEPITNGRFIILEGIQDPGNVGTVIRTANGFGIDTVVLTGGCADPYNPKTVRAAMGAVFRQRILEMTLKEIAQMNDHGIELLGAALGDGSRDIREAGLQEASVVIGSEGRGLSQDMLRLCADTIVIPINPACESLNASAAAAVIMWEMIRADKK